MQTGPKSKAAFNEELNVIVLVSVTMEHPLDEDSNNSTLIDSSEVAGVYCPFRSELSALKNPFPFIACQYPRAVPPLIIPFRFTTLPSKHNEVSVPAITLGISVQITSIVSTSARQVPLFVDVNIN